jgi:hypothetical protein
MEEHHYCSQNGEISEVCGCCTELIVGKLGIINVDLFVVV